MATTFTCRHGLSAAVLLVAALGLPRISAAQTTKTPPTLQASAQTLLTVDEMVEDLDYVVRILGNVHPATYRGFSKKQVAVIDAAYQRVQEPMSAARFYFVVNTVICSLQDGHTQLRPMTHNQNRLIDVPIIWLHDGFYVNDHRGPFQRGDRIVAMGGKSIETLYQQTRILIPAENEHRRKWCVARKIHREEFLDYLDVIENDAVDIRVERAGTEKTLAAQLKPAAQCRRAPPSRPWVGYQVDADLSLGVFHLDTCNPNDQYHKTVRAFFEEVSEKHIGNIAVDVRRNRGGNSRVVDAFFRYLNIDRYRHYGGDVRYSKELAEKTGGPRTSGYRRGKPGSARNRKVEDKSLLFDGRLFVLTSPATFSSGNWFAVIIKDNGLGTVIGEPTGNAPSSYGDVPTFQMPNTGFSFSVSHKRFVRPNPDNDPADALYPDVPVYTTIDDIINGIDPQLEKLKAMIRESDS